jgi:dolichol-phosphate mannosyltransferase
MNVGRPEVSIVVPVHNEADNVDALVREIAAAMDGRSYEMIFVDDASTDRTRERLAALRRELPTLRAIGHRRNAGQSRALRTGVFAARSSVVVTLDGDGQNDPADIRALAGRLTRPDAPAGLSLVQGMRAKRQDNLWKRAGSRLANAVRRALLRDGSPDSGCGARAFFRDAFLQLPYFDHMHRYLPALMLSEGLTVETHPVGHRPRMTGRSHYTHLGRLMDAVTDLRGVMWLARRRRDPAGVDEI